MFLVLIIIISTNKQTNRKVEKVIHSFVKKKKSRKQIECGKLSFSIRMNRNDFKPIPPNEAKLALDGAQPVSITNTIAIASTKNALSSSPSSSSLSSLPNCSLPLECDDQSDNSLNSIKVNIIKRKLTPFLYLSILYKF